MPEPLQGGGPLHVHQEADGEITDVPTKRKFHLMDCLRYLEKMNPSTRSFKQRFAAGTGPGNPQRQERAS
jgi:hypothetical protein